MVKVIYLEEWKRNKYGGHKWYWFDEEPVDFENHPLFRLLSKTELDKYLKDHPPNE